MLFNWIGECYYSQGNILKQLKIFNDLLLNYPNGDKVPAAYLKKGMSFGPAGKKTRLWPPLNFWLAISPPEEARLAQQKINEPGGNERFKQFEPGYSGRQSVKKTRVKVFTQKQPAVATFQIATNESVYYPDTKQTSQKTQFHRIVVWGQQAEFCNKYLDQGRQVLIEGKLRNRSWKGGTATKSI
jgi:hypothetical protein